MADVSIPISLNNIPYWRDTPRQNWARIFRISVIRDRDREARTVDESIVTPMNVIECVGDSVPFALFAK